jgi:hypothetical protein
MSQHSQSGLDKFPLRSESEVRQARESNALTRAIFSGAFYGEPSDDREAEHKAARTFFAAAAIFKSACQDAHALTDIPEIKDALQDILNALADGPSELSWAEKIGGDL